MNIPRFSYDKTRPRCGCRSADCPHESIVYELQALDAMIDEFARLMKEKLRKKAAFEMRGGWDDPSNIDGMRVALREHMEKGDPVDVANFAAFLWNHGVGT